MDRHLIAQGAEGKVFLGKLFGEDVVIKERIARKYRHPLLDAKIRQKRILQETRNMGKARKEGVPIPAVLFVDAANCVIFMEKITPGITVKEFLLKAQDVSKEIMIDLAHKIGRNIALLHNIQCIQGDLTTSNMMIKPFVSLGAELNDSNDIIQEILKNKDVGTVYMIDFGLSFISNLPEDMAVDLYVLERAIGSLHPECSSLFEDILEGYKQNCTKANINLTRLSQVRLRGRKRLAFG
ncbi:unnamed protein product [Blepharisma stoltei]|uniref:non-specific serine/threonine protein kinase n=1 Tax=Blepharisma stoltei TaxID=1481888 RepID=A0AAU9JJK9_9CILI|nr:unnamed protein product [Blepharisma stoltei]